MRCEGEGVRKEGEKRWKERGEKMRLFLFSFLRRGRRVGGKEGGGKEAKLGVF